METYCLRDISGGLETEWITEIIRNCWIVTIIGMLRLRRIKGDENTCYRWNTFLWNTHGKAVVDNAGEDGPYNGEPEYSINTERAQKLGFHFSQINDWIYNLPDYYIDLVK